jgi:hypothetical protein
MFYTLIKVRKNTANSKIFKQNFGLAVVVRSRREKEKRLIAMSKLIKRF